MSLQEKVDELRTLIQQRDEIDQKIVGLLGDSAMQVPKIGKARKRRSDADDDDLRPTKGHRHPMTDEIERLLIDGNSVPAVLEKVDVSPPTVYVIKARLKKEGRLV